MNLLQDLGGFVNSVLVGGRIIMFIFIDQYFYPTIIKNIYKIDTNAHGRLVRGKNKLPKVEPN